MTPHDRYRQTKNALVDQFNRPTTEEGNLLTRASILPLAQYDSGVGFAWPAGLHSSAQSINRLMQSGYESGDEKSVGDVANALLSVYGAGGFVGRPTNSIGVSGRPKQPLSKDKEEIMLRLFYEGRPITQIADAMGVSAPTVSRRYREYGLEARGKGGPGRARALPAELDDQLARARMNGVPVNQLIKDYGVDKNTVANALKRWRIRNPDKNELPALNGGNRLRWSHDLDE